MSSNIGDKAQYLLRLVGKKRVAVVSEVDADTSQFDSLIEMTENGKDFEEELLTATTEVQKETEDIIAKIYDDILENGKMPNLLKNKHARFLQAGLSQLPPMFKALDASQPWILYWSLNALNLLGIDPPEDIKKQATRKILGLQHKDGGIGGGLGQIGHAASTYAGILALAILGDEGSFNKIDREKIYKWLLTLKQKDGSFIMHVGGETDTRAVYCLLVVASLLDIITPELIEGTAEWLSKCQTFEGGFGGVPFDEAHGGYTFCAAAALLLLGKDIFLKHANLEKLVDWAVTKQMSLEGGFAGRSNKLVDGCYSFWVGGLLPIFDILVEEEVASRSSLQNYILGCCQNDEMGGLRDKPGKNPDFYHSNYVLLGLSVVQNKFYVEERAQKETQQLYPLDSWSYSIRSKPIDSSIVKVEKEDTIKTINPIFGLSEGVAEHFKAHFATKQKNSTLI